jgi:hypothetical protein
MSDNILSKFAARNTDPNRETGTDSDPDGSEDFGSFGWLRGQRERAVMIELRKKTGNILAIGYGWIERMEFDTASITLHAGNSKIVIKGRNLNAEARPQMRLFQGLTKHKVTFIQEADHAASVQADKKSVVVESLEW